MWFLFNDQRVKKLGRTLEIYDQNETYVSSLKCDIM